MGIQEKKNVVRELTELGKSKGQLSSKEILDIIGDLDFDAEQLEKIYTEMLGEIKALCEGEREDV